jgi:heme exporter protein C
LALSVYTLMALASVIAIVNTLHQPASVLRLDGPAIHVSILAPLLVMALANMVLFLALHLLAIRTEVMARRIRQMQLATAGKA